MNQGGDELNNNTSCLGFFADKKVKPFSKFNAQIFKFVQLIFFVFVQYNAFGRSNMSQLMDLEYTRKTKELKSLELIQRCQLSRILQKSPAF